MHYDEEIRHEASYVLINSCKQGEDFTISKLEEIGVLGIIAQALFHCEPEYLFNVLSAVKMFLKFPSFALLLEANGCLESLFKLEFHLNKKIREHAKLVLDCFYNKDYSE